MGCILMSFKVVFFREQLTQKCEKHSSKLHLQQISLEVLTQGVFSSGHIFGNERDV